MPIPVEAFFRQSAWATSQLIDICEGLSDEELDARGAGVFGSAWETLTHLAAVEQLYLRRLGTPEPAHPVREGEFPGFETLRRAVAASADALATLATTAGTGGTARWESQGVAYEAEPTALLVQVIVHSAEHRAHLTTILAQLGAGPPDLDERTDGWAWGEATGLLRVAGS